MSKIPFSTIDEGVDYFTEKMNEVYPAHLPVGEPAEAVDDFIHNLQEKALKCKNTKELYDYGNKALKKLKDIMPYKIDMDNKARILTPAEEAAMLEKQVEANYPDPDDDITVRDIQNIVQRW